MLLFEQSAAISSESDEKKYNVCRWQLKNLTTLFMWESCFPRKIESENDWR